MAPSPRGRAGSNSDAAADILSQLGGSDDTPAVQVPNLITDPVWSLGLFPIDIEFAGKQFRLPPMRAIDWLVYLMCPQPDMYTLISNIFADLEEHLLEQMVESETDLTIIDLYRLALDVLATASGRPWWVAIRLTAVAADNWHILGPKLIMSGVNAETLSLSAWLDCLLLIAIESMDPKDVTMFSLKLESQPPDPFAREDDEEVDPVEEMVTDRDAFLAFGN